MTAATVEEDITVCLEEWRHQKKTMISARCFFFPSKEELNKHLDQHRGLTFLPGLVGKGLY